MDAIERMVPVASCASRTDAELRAGALRSDGINAVVTTDDAGGQHPELTLSFGAVRLLVPDHEADRARGLLADLDGGVHALPSTDEHERGRDGERPAWLGWTVLALLGLFLAYRAVTLVIPGMG